MYIFKGRRVFIDVYKADDKIAASGATSLADIDLRRTYRATDSVATGRISSLFCDNMKLSITILLSFDTCLRNMTSHLIVPVCQFLTNPPKQVLVTGHTEIYETQHY